MNDLQRILNDMSRNVDAGTPHQEKTATASPAAPSVSDARSQLDDAVASVVGGTKQAHEQNSANGGGTLAQLEKIASDLADADEQATIKEGHLFGAAVLDGFLARANQWAQNEEKVAHAQQQAYQEDLGLYKQAADAGYEAMASVFGQQPRAKTAAEREREAVQELNDTFEKVAHATVASFSTGFEHMATIAEHWGAGE